jgi:hypothetical protein
MNGMILQSYAERQPRRKNGNGFFYTVQDSNGVPFTILNFRDQDNIQVTNALTGDAGTLTCRRI